MKTQPFTKLLFALLACFATAFPSTPATLAANFTAGNIVGVQADTASSNNTTATVVEINPNVAVATPAVQTFPILGTGTNAIRLSGSATSTGYAAATNDGTLFAFTGANNTNTSSNANTLNPRAVVTLDSTGVIALATTYTGTSGNQTRGATSLNNTNWFIGDQGGFYTNSATSASPTGNIRSVKAFGGTVYACTASASLAPVGIISAATGGTYTALPGLGVGATSRQDFYLISSGSNGSTYDVLYVLDATGNTAGTLFKYSLVSGSWTANGTYTTTFGGFGIVAAKSGGGAVLYVTTGQGALAANSLLKLTDTAGYNSTITITTANNVTLYTSPAGTVLKGIAFAPVAAVAQSDLAVSVSAPATATVNTNFDFTLTASNTGAGNASGVAVDFTVPSGLTIQSAAGTGFSTSTAGQVVHFTGGSINASANATLTVTVRTSTGATYTAPAGAAVIDPSNTISEANEANNASTAAAVTNVLQAPAITTQPNPSQTIASGTTANLTVAASGFLAPTYQWYQGVSGDTSAPVGGATSANFTTPALTITTSFWARATNATGSADSNTAVVNVSSANANLSSLALSAGALNPAFASGTLGYTVTVPNATASTTVTPTVADAGATVKVNNVTVTSGSPSGDINLLVGDNTITVAVTAQDLVTTKVYNVTVHRQSANADLSNLTLSAGTLTPAFAAGTTDYTATVSNATASLMVTPTVADATATVKVNNVTIASGSPSTVSLNIGQNTITVAVTAENLASKVYTVIVTRPGSSNADLSNLTTSVGLLSNGLAAPKDSLGFEATVTNYRSYLTDTTGSLTVTPTVADSNATVTVNGTPVTSGSPSSGINLVEGDNLITVQVTAQDAVTTKSYTIHAFRAAAPLTTGAIAFTGFDADGNDDLAFVALVNIPANSVIYFSDNEWNGSAIGSGGAFNDFNESEMVWIAPVGGVPAGTIVTLNNISATTTTNVGAVNFSDASNRGYSATAEAVYAFQGSTHVPSVFLAGLSADTTASFVNTGLTAGSTEVVLANSSDGGRYKGPRAGQTTFAGYLSAIGNVATNWDDIGNGDGTSFLPFSTAAFLAGPVAQVTINDVSINEGDSGTSTLTFTVTRSNNFGDFTVHFDTADGTGPNAATTADNDYQSASGTVTFTAGGATTQPVSVTINGDTTVESDQTFFVNLSNLVSTSGNATITDAQGLGTIVNDDAFAPVFATQPGSPTIATGSSTTLSVVVNAFPAATYQWYQGASGDTSTPIATATASSYTTPILLANASYWVRATNSQGSADSNTANVTVAYAAPNSSANINILNPNTASWNPAGVNVGGTQFVNLGLQGVGRFPASSKDPVTGESIGSISDMQITGWHKNGDGSYSGTLNTLPDRGYNSGAIFSNYAARINEYAITFTPYTASTPTTDQHQVVMNFVGSTRFTYDHDGSSTTPPVFTTGLLANGGVPLFGTMVPVATGPSTQSDGTVNNRLTLDSEGLILDSRLGKAGSGWIGDEYGAYIYHFNSDKVIDGLVTLPEALIPHATNGGPISFIDVPANVDGRRVNQGMEGIAQSPDGAKLFGLMQSATMQDSGSGNQGRFNARLVVYNISGSDTPTTPVAQYVIQLPRIDDTGLTNNGNAVSRTGAQSAIVALNDHQLLILSRDGNGRGVPGSASPVFKSILLADLTTATDINGTYDAAGAAVAPAGVLAVGVTPISWTEALNMIGKLNSTTAEITKFGLNLQGGNGDINTICEKWESLGLVSAKDPANPNDYFLFIGNDNDFLSATGEYLDANGVLQPYDAGLENDTLVLAFRVRFTAPEILVQQPAGTDVDNGGSVNFGPTGPGSSASKTFTIKNTGSSTLTINSIDVTGGDSADFAVNLTGTSLSLAAGAETTFGVAFSDVTLGSHATTLHIVSNDFNDGNYTATLTGQVSAADLTVTLVHNGTFHQRDNGDSFTATVTNTGNTATDGSTVTVQVTLPAGFVPAVSNNGTVNGWAVSVAGQLVTATRTGVLAAGASFPALPILVNVDGAAAASLSSSASVSGGGDAISGNNSASENTSVGAPVPVTFLGVSSGDADSTSAMLWTRINQTETVTVTAEVSTDAGFSGTPLTFAGSPDATRDYTLKVNATGLTAGTTYFYRFVTAGTGETSGVGTFKTAPAASASVPVHFAFSGDMDGFMRPYALSGQVPAEHFDFYVNLGDLIYETASNVAGNNGAPYLNSPSVALSNEALNFNGIPRAFIPAGTPFATRAQLFADYSRKYREQFLPVNNGGLSGLKDFYAGQGNYSLNDNHELGNRKYIDGGAPAGASVGGPAGTDMPTGRGVDARDNGAGNVGNVNDVNNSLGDYMNRSQGYLTLQQVYLNYQPIQENRANPGTTGVVSAPSDPRTDGTRQLFFSQGWGRNAIYIQTDARSYRDIRLKTANAGADDTGARADNTGRTFLGATQLAWLEQTLLAAQQNGTPWKFISISDPIDEIGPVAGSLASVTAAAMQPFSGNAAYAPVNADGGKAYVGGYRAERNALLKFIVDNHITNVVFLATDDHQNRINEILYSPSGRTGPGSPGFTQADYVKVPYCFSIVCGPLGATGPDLFLNHDFASVQGAANLIANAQIAAGVEPIGLMGYPGLHNVQRDQNGVLTPEPTPQVADFYSPDTFNYNILDVSADGRTLTVTSKGITSTAQNSALEYGANGNTLRTLFSFQIDAASDPVVYDGATTASPVVADGQVAPVNFGKVTAPATASRVFTLQNAGSTDLTGLSISFDGANAGDFSVIASPASSIAPGGTTNFTVQFAPTATGDRSATLHLLSNAPGAKASYDINLAGHRNQPPVLTLPTSPFVVEAMDASGATVNFTVTANDAEDGVLTPTVVPASGSHFNIGDTPVNVSATDNDGATTSGSFVVHVNAFVAQPVNPVETTLYSKGGAVPGAGTDARIQSGALWTGFGAPAVNDAGHLAYVGKWKSPASTGVKAQSGMGIFVDDTLIVKTTEAVPGITGAVFKAVKDPVIDAHGHVAFLATITNATGGSAVTPGNDTVVVSNASGTLEVLAREGDVAPDADGALYKVFSNVSVKDDSTLFTASLLQGSGTPAAAPANDAGVWWKPTGSASVIKLIREGDAGFTAGETIKSFVILKPVSGSAGQGRGQLDGASALLQVNLIKSGLVTQAVVVATPGNLGLVVEGNDTLGGTALPAAVWQKVGLPSSDDAGARLSLLGTLKTNVGTVTAGHTLGIFQSTNGGTTWEPVARAGSTPPGITDASTFTVFKDPVNSATDAGVAFIGTSKLGKVGTAGIWYQPEGGALSLIALQGQQPETGPVGAKWRTFTSLALPGGNLGPVFVAGLEKGTNGTPGPGGIDNSNDVGLYAVDSVGFLHEIIREGNSIGGKTVKAFSVLKALAGSAGTTRSFNSTGGIVVLVTFSDGSSTILRFTFPS